MARWIAMTTLLFLLLAAGCSGSQQAGEAESVIGDCNTGMTLAVGQGCTVANTEANDTFWVDEDGSGCYSVKSGGAVYSSTTRCARPAISEDAITATQNEDGSWTVETVP